ETQCTAVFNVVGENGQVTEAVLTQDGPVLENFTAGQSGTLAEGINNGIIWGGIAFGAGLAAIALAAGGGGGSSRHKRATEDEQKPVQPEGGQEAGKTDVLSTGSTEAGSGSSSGQVPAVTDKDGNGKADTADKALADAEAAVQAAEAKKDAADDAAAKADKDGNKLITPAEAKAVTDANAELATAKQAAQSAVDKLQAGDDKSGLQGRLDGLSPAAVPAVTDKDGNGKADTADKALADAEAAVQAAEAKKDAADDAAAKADKDGNKLITPAEAKAVTDANAELATAKQAAQSAVDKLQAGDDKSGLQGRLDGLSPAAVPAVTDKDGNGKADTADKALADAKAHLEKALNTVYQPNDDLYASYAFGFGKPVGNPEESTTTWREVLNQNGVSGFSVDKNDNGEFRYTYNGLEGSDIISTGYSIGGAARTMISRNDMVINTNGGDDIIAVGMDVGRSYSAGYTDKKYLTSTGDGDDILIVGLGNNNVGIHLKDDASLRISDRDDVISDGELLLPSSSYDHGSGGIISSTTITMGDGDDTLLALGYERFGNAIVNTDIDLGAGNDTIHVNGDVKAVSIKGGSGMDILAISHGTLSTKDFSGFEVIDLGDNNGWVNIIASDLVKSGVDAIEGGTLKIIGSSNSGVNLDGDDWKPDGVQSEDGVNYNVYTHEAAPDIKILIDEHITNVM
ncbi:GA-like domain-containing protein, partial [Escherichia coli]|uniref:GA-like domain-containing protein n=1 Tax=Escherichia coli TaxID=562 RepID=UPI002ACC1A61